MFSSPEQASAISKECAGGMINWWTLDLDGVELDAGGMIIFGDGAIDGDLEAKELDDGDVKPVTLCNCVKFDDIIDMLIDIDMFSPLGNVTTEGVAIGANDSFSEAKGSVVLTQSNRNGFQSVGVV